MNWSHDGWGKGQLIVYYLWPESDLLQYREMRSLPKPRQWQIENFDRLLKESQPIKKTEYKFLEDPEDLVSTYPSDPDQAHFLEPVERAYHAFIKFIGRVSS